MNNTIIDNKYQWKKTQFITSKVKKNCYEVIKEKNVKSQQLYYLENIHLSGNFVIEFDIKSDHGQFVSYLLNVKPQWGGGVAFGWRNIKEWTNVKIERINGFISIFYNNSSKPQKTIKNTSDNLLFFIRFYGFEDEIKIVYKNFKINDEKDLNLVKNYPDDLIWILNNKIEYLECSNNRLQKMLDSHKILLDNLFLNYSFSPRTTIKNSHELYKEGLTFINNVCKKHGLNWWLIGGSLLGAYRHEGFIPWDDDCDIALLRKDYDKFIQVIKEELKFTNLEDFIHIKTGVYVNNFLISFTKMDFYYKGNLLGFIDIFPYDFAKNNKISKNKFINVQRNMRKKLNENIEKNLVLKEVFDNLELSYSHQNYIMTGVEDSANYFAIFNYDDVFPLINIQIEERNFPAPKNTKKYLSLVYGNDFMEIPSVIYTHDFHKRLQKTDNINIFFEFVLKRIKEVNENFNKF